MINEIIDIIKDGEFIKSVFADFMPTIIAIAVIIVPMIMITTIFTLAIDIREIRKIDLDIRRHNNDS